MKKVMTAVFALLLMMGLSAQVFANMCKKDCNEMKKECMTETKNIKGKGCAKAKKECNNSYKSCVKNCSKLKAVN